MYSVCIDWHRNNVGTRGGFAVAVLFHFAVLIQTYEDFKIYTAKNNNVEKCVQRKAYMGVSEIEFPQKMHCFAGKQLHS